MSAGLQCWDSNGNLVVDLGDFNTRFVTRQNVSFPRTTRQVSVSVPGLTAANSFAVIMSTASGYNKSDYAAVTRSGGVDILYVPGRNPSSDQTLHLEVYMFN